MSDNVINLFENKKKKDNKEKKKTEWDVIMKRNADNQAKMARERARANKSVTRSHRLKR